MNDYERYREQIDACRPGSDDLTLDGLADLARAVESDRALAEELERSQRFDRSVAAAMHDVPVPEGMLERLLDRVSEPAAASDDESDSASVPQPPTTVEIAKPVEAASEHRRGRRLWLRAAAGLAAAAILAGVAVLMWPRPLTTVTADELAAQAGGWMTQVAPQAGWTRVAAMPADFPARTVSVTPAEAQQFRTAEGWRGAAYRREVGRATVTVFVFPSPRANIRVAGSPYTPLTASQGRSIAAWQSDGRLYVVVVEGPGLPLEHLIRKPPTV